MEKNLKEIWEIAQDIPFARAELEKLLSKISLDHKIVELALSIPEQVRTRNGTLKYILKKAVHGSIPDEIIDREKHAFFSLLLETFFSALSLAHFAKSSVTFLAHSASLHSQAWSANFLSSATSLPPQPKPPTRKAARPTEIKTIRSAFISSLPLEFL